MNVPTLPPSSDPGAVNRISRATARGALVAVLFALLAGVIAALATPAAAEEPAADPAAATEGWVRLAHLSPDTPSVDVALTAFDDSTSMLALADVSYGDVSEYKRLPVGTYVATMTPAGGDADSTPAITQAVTVEDGRAYTVAAVGLNEDLTGTVINDDLTPPTEGAAKIRLLQASVSADQVTVRAVGGPVIAENAAFATATGYAEIGPGLWSVQLEPTSGDADPVTASVVVLPGTVNTLIVLDGADGALTVTTATDAASVAAVPDGGVETGGGSTATTVTARSIIPGISLAVSSLALLAFTSRSASRRLSGERCR